MNAPLMVAIAKLSELLHKMKRQLSAEGGKMMSPFEQIMEIAQNVAAKNPAGLPLLMRALLRPIQAEHIVAVAENPQHAAPPPLEAIYFFFPILKVASLNELFLWPTPEVKISLATDLILPTPWRRSDYVNALTKIGTGQTCGPWTQDSNHKAKIWRPWNIAFVDGGNHSITAGILRGEGEILADEVWDLTTIFDRVKCDGRQYVDVRTGKPIAEVFDHRRAAVFEIGRLIVEAAAAARVSLEP